MKSFSKAVFTALIVSIFALSVQAKTKMAQDTSKKMSKMDHKMDKKMKKEKMKKDKMMKDKMMKDSTGKM